MAVKSIFMDCDQRALLRQAIWLHSLQLFEEAGTDIAQALTQKESMQKKRSSMSNDVAKALARLSSGLYVVTAANNSAKGAMIASWVAQASFEPLGLTIAVAKDRAIESLMQVTSLPTRSANFDSKVDSSFSTDPITNETLPIRVLRDKSSELWAEKFLDM